MVSISASGTGSAVQIEAWANCHSLIVRADQSGQNNALAIASVTQYLVKPTFEMSKAMPRDLIKTLTYLSIHLLVGFTVAYAFTGSLSLAGGIALVEPCI